MKEMQTVEPKIRKEVYSRAKRARFGKKPHQLRRHRAGQCQKGGGRSEKEVRAMRFLRFMLLIAWLLACAGVDGVRQQGQAQIAVAD